MRCITLLSLVVFISPVLGDDENLKAIEGKWVLTKSVKKGEETKAEEVAKQGHTYIIKGDRITFYRGDKKIGEATITIDAKKNPARIDIKPDNEGKEIGIYKVEKDTLTLCISTSSKAYPAKFESTKDSDTELEIFTKAKQ